MHSVPCRPPYKHHPLHPQHTHRIPTPSPPQAHPANPEVQPPPTPLHAPSRIHTTRHGTAPHRIAISLTASSTNPTHPLPTQPRATAIYCKPRTAVAYMYKCDCVGAPVSVTVYVLCAKELVLVLMLMVDADVDVHVHVATLYISM